MSSQHFAEQREALALHQKSIESEAPVWNNIAFKIKPGEINPTAFTKDGIHIGTAYNEIVEEYAWCAWRIGKILEGVADALEATIRNYGKTESIIVDDINRIGKQF